MRHINLVSFCLDLPPHYKVNPTFHVSLLKLVIPGPLDDVSPPIIPPEPLNLEGEPACMIKDIIKSRRRAGRIEYLVACKRYGPEEQSWVLAKNIIDPLLLQDFHHRNPNQPAPRRQGCTHKDLLAPIGSSLRGVSFRNPPGNSRNSSTNSNSHHTLSHTIPNSTTILYAQTPFPNMH